MQNALQITFEFAESFLRPLALRSALLQLARRRVRNRASLVQRFFQSFARLPGLLQVALRDRRLGLTLLQGLACLRSLVPGRFQILRQLFRLPLQIRAPLQQLLLIRFHLVKTALARVRQLLEIHNPRFQHGFFFQNGFVGFGLLFGRLQRRFLLQDIGLECRNLRTQRRTLGFHLQILRFRLGFRLQQPPFTLAERRLGLRQPRDKTGSRFSTDRRQRFHGTGTQKQNPFLRNVSNAPR